jgi:hypothetical protein
MLKYCRGFEPQSDLELFSAKIVKILYDVKCTQNHKFAPTFFHLWMDLKDSSKIIKDERHMGCQEWRSGKIDVRN